MDEKKQNISDHIGQQLDFMSSRCFCRHLSVRGHTVLSDSGNHLIRWYFAFSKSCLTFAISVQITFTGDAQQYENIE